MEIADKDVENIRHKILDITAKVYGSSKEKCVVMLSELLTMLHIAIDKGGEND
jgi:hypothetical protein